MGVGRRADLLPPPAKVTVVGSGPVFVGSAAPPSDRHWAPPLWRCKDPPLARSSCPAPVVAGSGRLAARSVRRMAPPRANAVRQVAPSPSSMSASWARAHMSSQGPRESLVAATSTALPCTGRTCHLNYRTLHGCHRPGLPSACLRVYDGWR
jgi:hypothetical protein